VSCISPPGFAKLNATVDGLRPLVTLLIKTKGSIQRLYQSARRRLRRTRASPRFLNTAGTSLSSAHQGGAYAGIAHFVVNAYQLRPGWWGDERASRAGIAGRTPVLSMGGSLCIVLWGRRHVAL
jgi:hypothetical protein